MTESGVEGFFVNMDTGLLFCCKEWTLESDPNLAEDTCSNTQGQAHRALVKYDYKITAEIFVSSGKQPEDLLPSVIEGADITLTLRVGTLKAYNNWACIVSLVSLKGCDANGLVTYDATFFPQVAKPALADYVPP